ncbi:oxidoreductase [Salibacterium lacus]|uniref:NADH:flavin oxidoreductase/NADH oxidase N-terminal domain-containing protein n=1 Tax=Salibacterium lacus TaxID=1898109 RepID=A0ABW5T7J2_9BACI
MEKQWWLKPLPLQHITLQTRIIMEVNHESFTNRDVPYPASFLAAGNIDSSSLERWKDAIHTVHKEEKSIFLQLEAEGDEFHTASRNTALHDIHHMIQIYADKAAKAEQAGFDGVEIPGTKGSVIHSFVSRKSNERTGNWGGSLNDRLHFPLAVARHVREYTRSDFPLFFRLPSVTDTDAAEELAMMARQLEASGVDLFHIGSETDNRSTKTSLQNILHTASSVKNTVSVPVIISTGTTEAVTSTQLKEKNPFDGISVHEGNESWKRLFLSET